MIILLWISALYGMSPLARESVDSRHLRRERNILAVSLFWWDFWPSFYAWKPLWWKTDKSEKSLSVIIANTLGLRSFLLLRFNLRDNDSRLNATGQGWVYTCCKLIQKASASQPNHGYYTWRRRRCRRFIIIDFRSGVHAGFRQLF